eukprot:gnl/TRDRNA2_/TRDRNA2_160416_c1_seq3.p1 gnl/TRDRNA2_/TRDRNA2_160416_c1~~gnl/TRDRNA2_/TRDRNA2_160416_c1_seq3.p1  ORF type:complete len:168 (-),score=32.48 gnl/TRDRNA2_/TRDRNA2_160416_c1_seq3:72-575(-)
MQLQQCITWNRELELFPPLSLEFRRCCLSAFVASQSFSSQLQNDVGAALCDLGAQVEEEAVTGEGYSIDALVVWHELQFAVEVDGPSHFLRGQDGSSINGPTLLKRRQLRALGWRVITVPYFEWSRLVGNAERGEYLLQKLQHFQRPEGTHEMMVALDNTVPRSGEM